MATIKVTDENFDQTVLKSDKPFVQRFTAEWCGPCKMIAPLLEELSVEMGKAIDTKVGASSKQQIKDWILSKI